MRTNELIDDLIYKTLCTHPEKWSQDSVCSTAFIILMTTNLINGSTNNEQKQERKKTNAQWMGMLSVCRSISHSFLIIYDIIALYTVHNKGYLHLDLFHLLASFVFALSNSRVRWFNLLCHLFQWFHWPLEIELNKFSCTMAGSVSQM